MQISDELMVIAWDMARSSSPLQRQMHADYLKAGIEAALSLSVQPVADGDDDERFLLAYVSRDTKIIGIEHPTEADWAEVLAAHVALRDRLNVRIAEQEKCPFNPSAPSVQP